LFDENPREAGVFPPFNSSTPDAERFAQLCSYQYHFGGLVPAGK